MTTYKKYLDIELFAGEICKHEYPWHFHDCYTIVIVEKGSLLYNFRNGNITLRKNEILIIAPFEAHKNAVFKSTRYKAFFLPKDNFDFLICGHESLVTQKIKCFRLARLLVRISQKMNYTFSKEEIKKAISRIYHLFSCYIVIRNTETANGQIRRNRSFQAIKKLDCASTVNTLSKNAHLSKSHFQREFKKNIGLTIGQLKQQQKTIEAKSLLEKGLKSTDVAYQLGYFDQSHFIKYFKKMWAVLPKEI